MQQYVQGSGNLPDFIWVPLAIPATKKGPSGTAEAGTGQGPRGPTAPHDVNLPLFVDALGQQELPSHCALHNAA